VIPMEPKYRLLIAVLAVLGSATVLTDSRIASPPFRSVAPAMWTQLPENVSAQAIGLSLICWCVPVLVGLLFASHSKWKRGVYLVVIGLAALPMSVAAQAAWTGFNTPLPCGIACLQSSVLYATIVASLMPTLAFGLELLIERLWPNRPLQGTRHTVPLKSHAGGARP